MEASTKQAKRTITIEIPESFEVMGDFEFLKIRELIKTGLSIASDKIDEDEAAKLLWPILQCANDIFDQYKETPDVLYSIWEARKQTNKTIQL